MQRTEAAQGLHCMKVGLYLDTMCSTPICKMSYFNKNAYISPLQQAISRCTSH